jgi:hypothetical protein
MQKHDFSLHELPAWCTQNNIQLHGVKTANISGRGNGLVARHSIATDSQDKKFPTVLIDIPIGVVISTGTVTNFASENEIFQQLLEAVGSQSPRHCIILFMLMQLVSSSPDHSEVFQHPPGPWTQYIGLQPLNVPVPTTWSEAELSLLKGTSLETPVAAKSALLTREFARLQAQTSHLPTWHKIFSETFTLQDWVWLDALFRSRSYDLPYSGEAMIPYLDLANHSPTSTALFQQDASTGTVSLVLRQGCSVSEGEEITINYGKDKSAAEMLFNYGFVDASSTVESLILSLDELLEEGNQDPLFYRKLLVFDATPTLELQISGDRQVHWSAPVVYLLCVNKEDGFAIENGRVLWQGRDVTGMIGMFSVVLNMHDLRQVFRFRALSIISSAIERQIERLRRTTPDHQIDEKGVRRDVLNSALQLRRIEEDILSMSLNTLNEQRDQLLKDPIVASQIRTR